MAYKECSNCEGEGAVVIWLERGEEVPASRKARYPADYPEGDPDNADSPIYECPNCEGAGNILRVYERYGA